MTPTPAGHRWRIGAIAMILAPIQFLIVTTAEALILIDQGHGYSFVSNTISNLGDPTLVPYPYYWMLNLSAIALGALVLVGLFTIVPGVPRGRFGRLATAAFALVGVGAIGVGIFNEHLNYPAHIASATIAFAAGGFALLFVGIGGRNDPRWRAWTIPSIVGSMVTAIALEMFAAGTTWGLGHGGWERLIIAAPLLWVVLVGIKFLREPAPTRAASSRSPSDGSSK